MQSLWINNKSVKSTSDEGISVINPATEEVIGTIPKGTDEDVDYAVQSAKKAFPQWSGLAPADRKNMIKKMSRRIEENIEPIAGQAIGAGPRRSSSCYWNA